jgi:hypothetical protein
MSERTAIWWRADPRVSTGYLLGVADDAVFRGTLRAAPASAWPTVYALLAQYLDPEFGGCVPLRVEKVGALVQESERRKRASVR